MNVVMDDDEKKQLLNEKWNPMLLDACKTGNVENLNLAIDNGADIWQFDKDEQKGKWNRQT
jgi:hypothetical protein